MINKNDFAIAVENSTANFIPKKNLLLGNLAEKLAGAVCEEGSIINLSFNSGWYSFASQIKGIFQDRIVVNFCLSEGEEYLKSLPVLFSSVDNVKTVIVTASEELAIFAVDFYQNKNVKVIYMPLSFDYEFYLKKAVQTSSNNLMILDEKMLAKCNRSAFADCVRRVFARNIFQVEMAINEVIQPHIDYKCAREQLDKANKFLNEYFKTHLIVYLVIAHLKSIICEMLSNLENIPSVASEILNKTHYNLSLRGEREYLIYKMLLRLYNFYFLNDLSFILKRGGIAVQEEKLNQLFEDFCIVDYSLPQFSLDDNKIKQLKEKISNDERVIDLLKNRLDKLEEESLILRREFGGKKYTVEHYNTKERARALTLAPYLAKEPSAFDLLFANGLLEYLL